MLSHQKVLSHGNGIMSGVRVQGIKVHAVSAIRQSMTCVEKHLN